MEIILLFMRRPLPMNRTFTRKLELSQFLSFVCCLWFLILYSCIFAFVFLYCWLHIWVLVLLCFHLQHSNAFTFSFFTMYAIYLFNKKIWHQAQIFNLYCPSLQQLHVCKMLVTFQTNQLLHLFLLNKMWNSFKDSPYVHLHKKI